MYVFLGLQQSNLHTGILQAHLLGEDMELVVRTVENPLGVVEVALPGVGGDLAEARDDAVPAATLVVPWRSREDEHRDQGQRSRACPRELPAHLAPMRMTVSGRSRVAPAAAERSKLSALFVDAATEQEALGRAAIAAADSSAAVHELRDQTHERGDGERREHPQRLPPTAFVTQDKSHRVSPVSTGQPAAGRRQ